MGGWAWNAWVLAAVFGLWLSSGTQREHALLPSAEGAGSLRNLEARVATSPEDEASRLALIQAYIEARAPGMAIHAVETAPQTSQVSPKMQHVYARALVEEGRSEDALRAERLVLDGCAVRADACDTWFLAAATRRADILGELVHLGVEDAQAYPEMSAVAYANATRQARLALR